MQGNSAQAPERKAETGEMTGAVHEFMDAFEGYREASDQRLAAIEKRMGDPEAEDRLDRIGRTLEEQEKRLDRLTLRQARPPLAGGLEQADVRPSEHRQAFEAYVRGGDEHRLRRLEERGMNGLTGADGGFLVPPETETEIGRRLAAISPRRGASRNRRPITASCASGR